MRLSLNSFEPSDEAKEQGSEPGYAVNEAWKNLGHRVTGAVYGRRHFAMAFSAHKSVELGLARLYHVVVGTIECIPVIGAVTAFIEKTLCSKEKPEKTLDFGAYGTYSVTSTKPGVELPSAASLLDECGLELDKEGSLTLSEKGEKNGYMIEEGLTRIIVSIKEKHKEQGDRREFILIVKIDQKTIVWNPLNNL